MWFLTETLLKQDAREDHFIAVGVAWAKCDDVMASCYCVQSEAETS